MKFEICFVFCFWLYSYKSWSEFQSSVLTMQKLEDVDEANVDYKMSVQFNIGKLEIHSCKSH